MINPFVNLSFYFSCKRDIKRDKEFCGRELGKFVPTPFEEEFGATGSQSAPYLGLDIVLQDLKLSPDDSIIDIGCGKGRAIAYLLSHGYNCKITGIEINPEVAAVAREWTKPYPNVEIIEGDAFGLDYNDYNVLYMYRPMDTGAFICFVELLEETLTHDIKLYYYVDIQSGFYINGRNGWTLEKQEYIYRVDGHYIHKVPQRYSVWTYTAKNNR